MRTAGAINWTPEREEQLRYMWTDCGMSSGDIAAELGTTRHSILAKRDRMGLPMRRTRVQPRTKRPAAKRTVNVTTFKLLATPLPGNTEPLKGPAWEPIPGIAPVGLMDLDADHCRWPVSDGAPFLFCGAPTGEGSYCAHHAARAYGRATC